MTSNHVRTMLETSRNKKGSGTSYGIQNAPQMLSEMIRELGHEPTLISVDALQVIADKLSAIAGKEPGWSWRYLRNVLNSKLRASEKLIGAILALGATIDGVPDIVASATPVQVLAVGNVAPGAVILADSKPCNRPSCPVLFVPRVPSQRYCSPDCKKKMRQLRRKA